MTKNVKRISITALFAALILLATAYLKVPISIGYVHAGDIFIILCCFFLPLYLSVPCVAIASMLADLLAGFVPYMPITFIAKAILAVFCYFGLRGKSLKLWKMIAFPSIGSVLMIAIYFLFEGLYYGFAAAIANLPAQFIQPAVALPVAITAIFAFTKIPYLMNFRSLLLSKRIENKRPLNLAAEVVEEEKSDTKDNK